MPLLVDTYNVLQTQGVLPAELAGVDLPGLITLLQASRYRNEQVDLVCDGHRTPNAPVGRVGGIRVRFAGDQTADDLIIAMIDRSTAPRQLTVVSSDHEILRAARRRRCRVLSSPQLLRHLADDADRARRERPADVRPPSTLSQSQVQSWMRLFAVDDAAAEAIERQTPKRPRPKPPSHTPPPAAERQPGSRSRGDAEGEGEERPARPAFPQSILDEAANLLESYDPPPPEIRDRRPKGDETPPSREEP